MAKLTLLALTLAALVAFATATTIITTTIEDENPISAHRQCSRQIQGQRLNQCRMFLQQGQTPYELDNSQMGQQLVQQCCQQLQNVEPQCQCEAVKQVFRDVQQQVQQQHQQQQQGPQSVPYVGAQQTQRLKQKAQILPNVCNLQSKRCEIGRISTTVVTESNYDVPFLGSQQCRQTEIQRPVTQCQRFVEQQMQSPMPYLQRPGQQQQQQPELQQCCNELQNVQRQCQCQAIKEVARRVMRQPQQQQQQGSRFGGDEMDIARRVIQNLPNQCYLEVQQCNIPY